jgi:hypothetical protein
VVESGESRKGPSKAAREARRSGEPVQAGDYFTLAVYNRLGTHLPRKNPNSLFVAERCLADASICYRLGNHPEWSKHRSRLGILLAETTRERLPGAVDSPLLELQEGACYEYIADLKLIADCGDATADLDAAGAKYGEAGTRTSSGEPFTLIDIEELNDYSIGLFNELVAVTTADVKYLGDKPRGFTVWGLHRARRRI